MLVHVVTLRFSAALGRFDDVELREFTRDKDVLSIQNHFFHFDNIPHLAFVVTYRLAGGDFVAPSLDKAKQDEAWRKILTDADMPLYQTLRDWRSKRCKQDGVPPYVICNNLQLATIVKNRPQTLAGLAKTDGFGKAKVEKFGQEILDVLGTVARKTSDENQPPVEPEVSKPCEEPKDGG